MGAPQDYVAASQKWVKRRDVELGGDGLERFDCHQRDGRIHVGCFAEEPVTEDAFARHHLDPVEICGGDACCAVVSSAEVGMARCL